ncbi:MAG: proline dehydrogenase family protein [Ktedonobacterales bacterium]|nr:proline dehydrogenase family protein [Ktedonobacterales bacterium]
MLKDTMLYLAKQEAIRDFFTRNPAARRMARRFVAGETLDEAIEAARALNERYISVSLDHLGENVTDAAEAEATARDYLAALDCLHAQGVEANISIKLTALGLDIDPMLCRANLARVLARARDYRTFVRVDMEGSAYTQRTLDLVMETHAEYGNVGTVLQSCLYRTPEDVARLVERRIRVRLVKGAYLEPVSVAYPRKSDVDAKYVELMYTLLEHGTYPAIATHDERLLEEARRFTAERGIARARFEFQMLYGIRRDLQEQLAREGYNVRVYVPYGTQWYPYLTRRMAERPANLMFVVSNTFRG